MAKYDDQEMELNSFICVILCCRAGQKSSDSHATCTCTCETKPIAAVPASGNQVLDHQASEPMVNHRFGIQSGVRGPELSDQPSDYNRNDQAEYSSLTGNEILGGSEGNEEIAQRGGGIGAGGDVDHQQEEVVPNEVIDPVESMDR